MPTSLEHGPKYRCRKVNRGRHTLEMTTIPNTNHLREKGRRKEGAKRAHNQREMLNSKPY